MNISIPKKTWNNFTEEEMNRYVDSVFTYYKNIRGFPYYPTDKENRDKEFNNLLKYNMSDIITNDTIKQTMHGLALAWSYFPHSWEVICNGMKTPKDVFDNDELFRKVIEKRIKIGDNMSDSGIRKMMKIFTGVQCVSNFRPTAAGAIYDMFAKNGVVWDMSGGFGGRLLGAIKSEVRKYITTDPSTKTYKGLVELNADYGNEIGEIHKLGSEQFTPDKNSLDLCFTSPPYFNTEQYSDEKTQSYNKYDEQEKWRVGFLRKTMENCYFGLKNNKHMLINIANVRSYKNLEEDTIKSGIEAGFTHTGTLKMVLSSMTTSKTNIKYEPIFVFKK